MIIKEKVKRYFHGTERYNCAQSVAKICSLRNDHTVSLDDLKVCGGGRAPQGRCGALHALLLLTDKAEHADLTTIFTAATGAQDCATIRALKQASCTDCVDKAVRLFVKK